MRTSRLLSLSILVAALATATSGALATDAGGPSSRAEVKALVLSARAHGGLTPAGEAVEPFSAASPGESPLSRRQVRDETIAARFHGELIPAGEGMVPVVPAGTQLARATVRESVLQARLDGELIPAGEGIGPVERHARARPTGSATIASLLRR